MHTKTLKVGTLIQITNSSGTYTGIVLSTSKYQNEYKVYQVFCDKRMLSYTHFIMYGLITHGAKVLFEP